MVELTGKKTVNADARELMMNSTSMKSRQGEDSSDKKNKSKKSKRSRRTQSQQINYAKRIWIFVAVLFVLLCFYFIGCFVWVMVNSQIVGVRIDEIDAASYRRLVNRRLLFFTRENPFFLAVPYDTDETSYSSIEQESYKLLAEYFDVENDLLFGQSGYRGLPGSSKRDPKQDKLMFENGCLREVLALGIVAAPVSNGCTTALNNIMQSGLHNAITTLIRATKEFIIDFNDVLSPLTFNYTSTPAPSNFVPLGGITYLDHSNRTVFNVLNSTLNGPDWRYIEDLSMLYVRPGITQSTSLYITEVSSFILEFLRNRLTVTIVMLLLLVFCFFLLYVPFLNRLDQKLKDSRSLLLFLPQNIASQTDMFAKILKKETGK
eukprot:GILI01017293.1.p1 GENE.GILI01017293.1~~GILI01017293.1.p1  ORF type:complete len:376 (+),score=65.36 GILI01017293.1:1-1128(+)